MFAITTEVYNPSPELVDMLMSNPLIITTIRHRWNTVLEPIESYAEPLILRHMRSSRHQIEEYIAVNPLICMHRNVRRTVAAIRVHEDKVYLALKRINRYSLLILAKDVFLKELDALVGKQAGSIFLEMVFRVSGRRVDPDQVYEYHQFISYEEVSRIIGWDWESYLS